MNAHRSLNTAANGHKQRDPKLIHLQTFPSSISMRLFHRTQSQAKVRTAYMTCRLERLDVLTRLTENSILIESDSETDSVDEPPPNQPPSTPPYSSPSPSHEQLYDEHSDDELPDIQDLLCSRSSQEASSCQFPRLSNEVVQAILVTI